MIGADDLERLRPTASSSIMPPGVGGGGGGGRPRVNQQPSASSSTPWFASENSRESQLREFRQEAGWDGSVHRSTPANLRGMKPMTGVTMEPWARDAAIYAGVDVEGNGEEPAQASLSSMIAKTRAAKKSGGNAAPSAKAAPIGPGWNSSPQKNTPYALRGIKPVTNEPWTGDERDKEFESSPDAAPKKRATRKKAAPPSKEIGPGWDSSKTTHFSLAKPKANFL